MSGAPLPLHALIGSFAREDRANLAATLRLEQTPSVDELCETIRWLYHSRVRRAVVYGASTLASEALRLGESILGTRERAPHKPRDDDDYPIPTWSDLVEGLARKRKVYDRTVDLATNEQYICQDVIVRALGKMKPAQRLAFFERKIDFGQVQEQGASSGADIKGARRGFAVLAMAEAAGFSLYTASSSALGLLSGSIGLTLPFAAYTGLSSLLSIVTGPVGWLAMGGYLGYTLTDRDWRRLEPAIVYIINLRARPADPGRMVK